MDCRLDDGEEAGQLGAQSLPLLPGKDAMVFLGLPGLRRRVGHKKLLAEGTECSDPTHG